ncbi:hypothetical protein PT974_07982 [Cladobotryum mycophilum]|uniref:SUR7 protein n=1 Tax=Cladobotryum mycophilum TaxID=491253 RepID=A0ABR0SC18_9HYPO
MAKFSCGFILIPAALVIHVVLFCGLAMILQSGTGSLNNHGDLLRMPGLYIARIDASNYKTKSGGEDYVGLPDSHDFSKNKDFFTLYPALYCSGMKKGDNYEEDYCSHWGGRLFDLQRLWTVWGVDLVDGKVIASNPRLVFVGLLVSAGATIVTLAVGLLSFCYYWSLVLTTVLAWISSISFIGTAAVSHMFINRLLSTTKHLKATGDGYVSSKSGPWYGLIMWISAGLALLAALLWTIITWRKGKTRARATKAVRATPAGIPLKLRVGGIFGGKKAQASSYKHLSDDFTYSGAAFRETSMDLGDRGEGKAFEPMRHRSVG